MKLGELLDIVGVERHVFSKWVQQGLLDIEEIGRGTRRFYTYNDLKRCLAMKSLSQIGLRPPRAIELIRSRTGDVQHVFAEIEIDWDAIDTKVSRLARYQFLEG